MTHETQEIPPLTVIEARSSRFSLNLRELWASRDLLRLLALRDLQVRYKQTLIGVAWALLQPLVTTAIFTIIFSTFGRFDTDVIHYPAFVLAGLSIWLFVHSAVTVASGSFVNNANLVTKVYFPRLLVPISATLALVLDFAVSLALLVVVAIYYRVTPTPSMIAAPIYVLLAIVLSISLGILLSALTVRFRDVKFLLPFALQIWMIASPVFYPLKMIPARWQLVFAINPLTGILDGFRSAAFGQPFNWPVIGISTAVILLLSFVSIAIFRGMEDEFADVI